VTAVADAVWNTSRNLRDCVIIGKLARSEEDLNFLDPQESQIAVVIAVGMVSVAFWLSYHQSWL
jgi:hypothetical protein